MNWEKVSHIYDDSLAIMSKRHTITVNNEVFQKLKQKGTFGESYNKLISRLIDCINDLEGASIRNEAY